MKSRILVTCVMLVAVAAGILGYLSYDEANRDFSPWMSVPQLTDYLKQFDAKAPDQPDFWKRGHWITAAEGRWHDGMAQYRIRYAAAPKDREFIWYWFIDQDQDAYSKKLKEYSDGGYTLVYDNSFKRPDGSVRYQGVWHKTSAGAAAK